jgi:RNA polymerase sporulation-specific sigma factor
MGTMPTTIARPVRPLNPEQRQLVADNLGLAGYAARRFIAYYPEAARAIGGWDELLANAHVGLCRAAMAFDAGRGVRFATYGPIYIFRHLQHVGDDAGHIRIPRHITGEARAELVRKLQPRSLETLLSEPAGSEQEPADREDETLTAERAALHRAVRMLDRRHRRVLLLRRRGLTLRAIAGKLGGLTRERARQLLAEAIEQVRDELRRQGWDVPAQKETPPARANGVG